MATHSSPPLLDPAAFRTPARRRRSERRARLLLHAAALLSILVSVLIVAMLARNSVEFLRSVELGSLWEIGWFPRRGLFDVRTILVGTLLVSAIAMLVAMPLGLGAAFYLSEYAPPRVRRRVKPVLEVLAGVPSVVVGFFAISFITPNLLQRLTEFSFFNLTAAGIGVGILTLPIIASIAEDAMRSVPQALREGAYGLGSRKVTVCLRVVFPAAISGILAAFIVGMSRAIGETMVVAIAAGGTGGSLFTLDIRGPGQTMTGAMAALGAGTDQVRGNSAAFSALYFVGFLLFTMTLMLNIISDRIVRRFRERY